MLSQLRALWKIELCQMISIFKYSRNKTDNNVNNKYKLIKKKSTMYIQGKRNKKKNKMRKNEK